MIQLTAGINNTVRIKITTSIDLTGYKAILAACGVAKTITNLESGDVEVTYTSEQVSNMSSTGTYGTLSVYDGSDKLYLTFLPFFVVVPKSEDGVAKLNRTLNIVVPSTVWNVPSSGGGGGSLVGRTFDFSSTKGMIVADHDAVVAMGGTVENYPYS